jgi:(R,R)-butanediol dehydrogenase/meso-butanediol dehydrogenase/diacetyl reductase
VTATSTQRAGLALELGATHFFEPSAAQSADIAAALGGQPEIVFECVGKPGLINRAIGYVRSRGTVVALGLCTQEDHFDPLGAIIKEVRIQMAALYDIRDFEASIDVFDRGLAEPRSMVTDTVTLDETPAIFEALRTRTTQCKVLVAPHS